MSPRETPFTDENLTVWGKLLQYTRAFLERVDRRYLDGFEAIAFHPLRIPTLEELNSRLSEVGWTAVYVDGYVHAKSYARMLANRLFPVARNIRSAAHLDHSPTPDMIHDLLGHLPLLFCRDVCAYMRRWAEIVLETEESPLDDELYRANREMSLLMSVTARSSEELRAAQDRVRTAHEAIAKRPSSLTHLGRIFLWSVEFGLLGSSSYYSIIGSGLMSAPKERERLLRGDARLFDYALNVIHHDIQFSAPQHYYFVSPSFDVYEKVLDEYVSHHRQLAN